MYTIQKNLDTRERQMTMWKNLIFDFAKSQNTYVLTFSELFNSPICCNSAINRRLKMDSIREIAKWMVDNKFADFTANQTEGNEQDKIFVYWRSLQEVAQAIFKWAKDGGKIGSIETVLDIIEDEFQKGEMFYKMPIEMVLNALYLLQDEGKAQVIYSENTDSYAVKFFNI